MSSDVGWGGWIAEQLDRVSAAGQWREPRTFDGRGVLGVVDGKPVTTFASNDYLGLTGHAAVVAAATEAAERWGTGAGASRLVVGTRPVHGHLESALADWKGTERALVMSSGFAANLSVLSVLGGPEVTICSDELNHASLIDGCRLSKSQTVVVPHVDLDAMSQAVADARNRGRRCLVATDATFSMDGNDAPLAALADLCQRTGSVLLIDEAHSVLAHDSLAELSHDRIDPALLVRVGTLSKTLGSAGGFVAGTSQLVDLLTNRARPFIFSTAISPPDAAAALAALQVLRSPEGEALLDRLQAVVDSVSSGHPSPILPIVVGSELDAVAASAELLAHGLHIPAIRPPTVAVGTSRLRIAFSAEHTDEMIQHLLAGLTSVGLAVPQATHPPDGNL